MQSLWSEDTGQDCLNGDATRRGKGATVLTASSTRACGRARAPDTTAGQLLLPIFTSVLAKPLHQALLLLHLKKNLLFVRSLGLSYREACCVCQQARYQLGVLLRS